MSESLPMVSRDRFTDAQRRRAEALLWVHILYPTPGIVSPVDQWRIAYWVATGRVMEAAR